MITKITILSNGSVAPNKPIMLGYKYESVGDVLQFDIPTEYTSYHLYLFFSMKQKKKKPIEFVLPVNKKDGKYEFVITTKVTENPGSYEMIFLATEDKITDDDINTARKVFVSNTMIGLVENNSLSNPVPENEMDPNLKVVYDELLDLKDTVADDLEKDAYRGAAYIPDVDSNGIISWARDDGKNIAIPEPRNITGPVGPYYKPVLTDGVFSFEKSLFSIPDVESLDVYGIIKEVSDQYLEGNLEGISSAYLDQHLEGAVDVAVDEKFKWTWDPKAQILYIEAKEITNE